MINRKKFDQLSNEERLILANSIGYPDYSDSNDLFNNLNMLWSREGNDVDRYIATVSKLKE